MTEIQHCDDCRAPLHGTVCEYCGAEYEDDEPGVDDPPRVEHDSRTKIAVGLIMIGLAFIGWAADRTLSAERAQHEPSVQPRTTQSGVYGPSSNMLQVGGVDVNAGYGIVSFGGAGTGFGGTFSGGPSASTTPTTKKKNHQ